MRPRLYNKWLNHFLISLCIKKQLIKAVFAKKKQKQRVTKNRKGSRKKLFSLLQILLHYDCYCSQQKAKSQVKLIQNLFSATFIAIIKTLFHHTTATLTSLIFEIEQQQTFTEYIFWSKCLKQILSSCFVITSDFKS